VQPAAQALVSRLRTRTDAPEGIGVEFGLELIAKAGAFIAAASGTANFDDADLATRPPWSTATADLGGARWRVS
jgi:hypothetical protein